MTKKYRRAAWIAVFAKCETTAEFQLKKFHPCGADMTALSKAATSCALPNGKKKTFCIADIHVMCCMQTFLLAVT